MIMNIDLYNQLFLSRSKTLSVKIELLDWAENPVKDIQGLVETGNVNVDGNSPIRRTANLSIAVLDSAMALTEMQRDFTLNKKVRIFLGLENTVKQYYYAGEIIWFNLGTFILTGASFQHSSSKITMNITCQDKMAMWNGSLGGELQGGAEFFDRDPATRLPTVSYSYLDIIQMAANVLGGLPREKIIVSDLEEKIKGAVKYVGDDPITVTKTVQNVDGDWVEEELIIKKGDTFYQKFKFGPQDPNEENGVDGYSKGAGETLSSVFDDIISMLGNYEYFFDLDGNFIFQEKKNYTNRQFVPIFELSEGDGDRYTADFSKAPHIYDFSSNELISNITNNPDWAGIKNNFLVYGTSEYRGQVVYHLCIDSRPEVPPNWDRNFPFQKDRFVSNGFELYIDGLLEDVDAEEDLSEIKVRSRQSSQTAVPYPALRDEDGVSWRVYMEEDGTIKTEKYGTAGLMRVELENSPGFYLKINNKGELICSFMEFDTQEAFSMDDGYLPYPWQQYIVDVGDRVLAYNPKARDADLPRWYKELAEYWTWKPTFPTIGIYNPDTRLYVSHMYNTEVATFNARTGEEEVVRVGNIEFTKKGDPSEWRYFFDIIDEASPLGVFSINNIGIRTKVQVDDKITSIYPATITDNLVIISDKEAEVEDNITELRGDNQEYMVLTEDQIKYFELTGERDAFNQIRNLLWVHTSYNEVVTATGIPLYFLEPNYKVKMKDEVTSVHGDFLLTSFSFGLDPAAQMNMTMIKTGMRI